MSFPKSKIGEMWGDIGAEVPISLATSSVLYLEALSGVPKVF